MELTTDTCIRIYEIIKNSKMTKMDNSDKYLLIKILRSLKSINDNFIEYKKDASERLRPDNWNEIVLKAEQWNKEGENTSLTEDERRLVNLVALTYEKSINSCINEELTILNEINVQKLSLSAFEKFLESNDFDAESSLLISEYIVDNDYEEYENDKFY